MSDKKMRLRDEARIRWNEQRELETNEHDFAFLDGFDTGWNSRPSDERLLEVEEIVDQILGGTTFTELEEMATEYRSKYPKTEHRG